MRSAFDLDPEVTFLNHGSYGALPRVVRDAQRALGEELEGDPVAFMESVPGRLVAVRERVAGLLGAAAEDLALVENATTGVSTVLRAIPWRPGDRIVVTDHGYGAVREAVEWVARRYGAVVDVVCVPFPVRGPDEVMEAFRGRIAGARLVIVDWITSPTAIVMPVAAIVAACRAEGVAVLVDGAHAPGHVDVDLDGLGADYVTGNLHKWCFAARGSAVLWARRDRQEGLDPLALSHPLREGFPRSFDWTGTRDPTAWLAIPAALDLAERWGGHAAVSARNRALCTEAAGRIAGAWSVTLPVPEGMRGSMATIPARGTVEGIRVRLMERRVQVPVVAFGGAAWVRISAQVYNEVGEYEGLVGCF